MPGPWYIHDAGFFSLELPQGWISSQPNTGTLLIHNPAADLALSLLAISRVPLSSQKSPAPAPAEAQLELQKWIHSQTHIQVQQAPRLISATYATATTEGLQHLATRHSFVKRLFLKLRGQSSNLMRWRFWSILNPHLLLLASATGKPATLEKHRDLLDHLIASIHLPEREILLGRHFTETVVSLARSWFPQTAVALIDDAHLQFGTQHLSLAGLHRRYLASPEQLSIQVRAFLTAVQVNMPASSLAGTWRHASERIMPVFLTPKLLNAGEGTARNHIVHEDWINHLAIGYALEDLIPTPPPTPPRPPQHSSDTSPAPDPAQRIIMHQDLMRWKVSPEELHAQAMQNLILYSHEHIMEGRRADGFTMLCLAHPDRHNAARILLPELHHKLRQHLGTTFLAAFPTREILIAFNDAGGEFVSQMRENVAHDFQNATHPISPKLFLVTPDGIAGDPDDMDA